MLSRTHVPQIANVRPCSASMLTNIIPRSGLKLAPAKGLSDPVSHTCVP